MNEEKEKRKKRKGKKKRYLTSTRYSSIRPFIKKETGSRKKKKKKREPALSSTRQKRKPNSKLPIPRAVRHPVEPEE